MTLASKPEEARNAPSQGAAPDACPVADLPKIPAATKPCLECPWRKSNTDREHYTNQYSTQEFTRLWRSIAVDGDFFGCHLFDADYHPVPEVSQAMGYKKPADVGARRECAGSVAMIAREIRLADSYSDYSEYIKARPVGLSQRALGTLKKRWAGDLAPALRFPEDEDPDLADPMERVDQDSWEWLLSDAGQANLLVTLEAINGSMCECPVCTNHSTVHPSRDLVLPDGVKVPVDEELHGLLTAMIQAGIQTIDSCIDIADALDQLWPERKPTLLRAPAGKLNYRNMILQRAAHIRFNNMSTAAKAFQQTAEKTPGIEVSTGGSMTQIIFQPTRIPVLTTYANGLKALLDAPKRTRKEPRRPTDRRASTKAQKGR